MVALLFALAKHEPMSSAWGDAVVRRIRPQAGAIVGALTAVAGYLVTLVLVVAVDSDYVSQSLLPEVGQLFYSAMFIQMHRPAPGGPESAAGVSGYDGTYNALLDAGRSQVFAIPTPVYHAIPVVVFLLAGFALARIAGARTPLDGALAGGSAAFGAVVFALLGTLAFASDIGQPPFFMTVIVGGLVYPGVLGAAGGAAGPLLARAQTGRE